MDEKKYVDMYAHAEVNITELFQQFVKQLEDNIIEEADKRKQEG